MIPGLAILILIAIAAAVVLLRKSQPAPIRATGESVCGHCEYRVAGLERMLCPECGSDLKAVGIVRREQSIRARLLEGLRLGLLSACGVVTAILLFSATMEMMPRRARYFSAASLASPASGAYAAINMTGEQFRWDERRPVLPIKLTLAPVPGAPGVMSSLAVDVRDAGFNQQTIIDWFSACGLDTTQPAIREEARWAAITVQRIARGMPLVGTSRANFSSRIASPQFAVATHTFTANRMQDFWLWSIVLMAWLLCVCGLLLFSRRRRSGQVRDDSLVGSSAS